MNLILKRTPALVAGVLLASAFANHARAAGVLPVIDRPALRVVAPERSVLLAVTNAGSRLVAVGERGVVTVSDDDGVSWRQSDVPTSVTLTNVAFADARRGWAVGHSGVVLHTDDGGVTWERQFDGLRAAAAAERDAAAQRGALSAHYRKLAAELVADGPDAPFLAILATDATHAMIAGANGLLFATSDGGRHWVPRMAGIDNRRGLHYYALVAHGRELYLAGEAGFFARSSDGGHAFTVVRTPYAGSFFGAFVTRSGELYLSGFHGTILASRDGGAHFHRVASSIAVTITSSALLSSDSVVMTTQAGALAVMSPQEHVRMLATPPFPLPAGIAQARDGQLIVVGFAGALRVPLVTTR